MWDGVVVYWDVVHVSVLCESKRSYVIYVSDVPFVSTCELFFNYCLCTWVVVSVI